MHVFLVDNEHFRFPGGREESGARSAPSRSPLKGDTFRGLFEIVKASGLVKGLV